MHSACFHYGCLKKIAGAFHRLMCAFVGRRATWQGLGALLALFSQISAFGQSPLGPWTRQIKLSVWQLHQAAAGNGIIVAVGTASDNRTGAIVTSADTRTWAEQFHESWLKTVIFGNGVFVAAGPDTAIISTNGTQWSKVSGLFGNIYLLSFNNGVFLCQALDASFASTNGMHWQPIPTLPSPAVFGNGRFVSVGHNFALVSTNGFNWETHPNSVYNSTYLAHSVYGNGIFLTSNGYQIYVSSDGIQWDKSFESERGSFSGVRFQDGSFFCVLEGKQYRSQNGRDWIEMPAEPLQHAHFEHIDGSSFDYPKFWLNGSLQISPDTHLLLMESGGIATSTDLLNWTIRRKAGLNIYNSIVEANGTLVVVGGRELFMAQSLSRYQAMTAYSNDGTNWISQELPSRAVLSDVAYGSGLFAAVGSSDAGNVVYTSPDGIAWTLRYEEAGSPIKALASDGTAFVGVGDAGQVLHSTNGIHWAKTYVPDRSDNLKSVAYGKGKFVAGGWTFTAHPFRQWGSLYTSSNGRDWTRSPDTDQTNLIASIVYGADQFFAAAWDGPYFTSPDGENWQRTSLGGPRSSNTTVTDTRLNRASYLGGWYLVEGLESDFIDRGWVSADLKNWTRISLHPSYFGKKVLHGGRVFVPSRYTIMASELLRRPTRVSIRADRAIATEANQIPASFTVYREGPTTESLTVQLELSGTAGDADIENIPKTVVFPPRQSQVTLPLRTVPDLLPEADETITISLFPGEVFDLAENSTATILIKDAPDFSYFRPDSARLENDGTLSMSVLFPSAGEYVIETSEDLRAWSEALVVPAAETELVIRLPFEPGAARRYFRARSR